MSSRSSLSAPSIANQQSNGHTRAGSNATSMFSLSPRKKQHKRSIERPQIVYPRIREKLFGSALGARTTQLPSYTELGPPDLVHISKYNKQLQKEEGEYHFITGVDMGSQLAPLGYLTMLNMNHRASERHPNIFTYCSFNCFSRCDVRIRCEFDNDNPASNIQFQALPSDRSQKSLNEIPDQIWDELNVCTIVRSIVINTDLERKLPALIEKNILQSTSISKKIILKLINYLDRGYLLGANEFVQKPSLYENFLIDALFKVVEITGLHQFTIDRLKILERSDLNLIIIKLLFAMDEEIQAIKLLNSSLTVNPRDSFLLNEQIKFLITKNQPRLACKVGEHSILANPLNFDAWFNLTKSYILNDDISNALITLNSTPIYQIRHKDLINIDPKDTIFLPEPSEGKIQFVWSPDNLPSQIFGTECENLIKFVPQYEIQAVDPALLRINRKALKGTHQKAYDLLILIINKIGWDGLLKTRSKVFIMDEEYKNNISNVSLSSKQPYDIKTKRQCERWLDDLFLIIYEDLRVVLIVENELENQKQLKHSVIEWELIGLTSFRTHHYKNAIASLRTTLGAKFDIISALTILKLWIWKKTNKEFNLWENFNQRHGGDFDISLEIILDILLKAISYNIRYYNEFQLDLLIFMKMFFQKFDMEFIKSKIQVLFENDNNDMKNSGIIPSFDSLLTYLQNFDNQPS